MPIVVHLDGQLAARGITLTELAQCVGITLANLSILKTGKARAIRFSTLEAICHELDCQPGDLLAFEPAASPAAAGSPHPQPAPADSPAPSPSASPASSHG